MERTILIPVRFLDVAETVMLVVEPEGSSKSLVLFKFWSRNASRS